MGIKVRAFAACVAVVLIPDAAIVYGAPIVFTDRAAFEAAAEPNRHLQFDADFSDCNFPDSSTCVHTFGDLLTVAYDIAGIGLLGDSIGLGPWGGQTSGALFREPVRALGFDLISIPTPPRPIVNADGSVSFDFSPQPSEFHIGGSRFPIDAGGAGLPRFFGVVFDRPTTFFPGFALVNYATPHGGLVGFSVQDMSITTVPEPSTMALFTAATLVMAAAARKRRQRARGFRSTNEA
jgi:hypothetical protein